ncbi:LOW QUALITY PROTEIN: transducin beta-like protein 2 [Paramacrobiotus metropolitanus]|uniref:LOW QUALITY PROTEIN: transducin beta-like protein 2 n=1 Tax=Paramacrobiotus metropolitanus TaxID=2943436 RepID=UPI002445B98C|nr:LOW QUALITY PROTEIN: transducin beta-like protein 2 [Paramacrobiotus metropolitanus]
MADSQASSLLSWSSITTLSITLLFGKKTDAETASADAPVTDRGAAEKGKAAKETGKNARTRARAPSPARTPRPERGPPRGFTPEVRAWAIVAEKSSGDVQSVEKAFELTGHSAAIPAFAFSGDSTHMLSVSKDKSFRLFDVNVDYKKRQSPRLVQHAPWTAAAVDDKRPLHCALTNDSRCVVIAYRADLLILSGVDGTVRCRIDSCLAGTPGGGSVDVGRLLLDPTSGFVLVIGGRVVRVFRNLVGLEVAVEALKESLKFASQDSVRSRIQGQMEAAETALQACRKKFTL